METGDQKPSGAIVATLQGIAAGVAGISAAWGKAPRAVKTLVFVVVFTGAFVAIYKTVVPDKKGIRVEHNLGQVGDNNKQDLTVMANKLVVGRPARHLDDELRNHILDTIPKIQMVSVASSENDTEAFQFAEEILVFLREQSYVVNSGVSTGTAHPPVTGTRITTRTGSTEIFVGANSREP